ncbi:MAG: hypothetical protein ACR2J3_13050 [Aridibacter sp.]
MESNKLSYRIIELNDQSIKDDYFVDYEDSPTISFEFLIDGKPIGSLLETNNKAVPYYYFENDLPSYFHKYRNKEIHIIGVCSCGIDSCGNASCILEKEKEFVVFREIFKDGYEFPENFQFKFSRENFDAVITEIVEKANEYKKSTELENIINEEKL